MSQSGILKVRAGGLPPTVPTSFVTNSGTAIPAANVLNILATSVAADSFPARSTGAGNTVTIAIQTSQAIAATDATKIGLAAFDSSQFTVDSNGFVSLTGASAAIEKVNVQAGTTPIVPLAGSITINGSSVSPGINPVRTNGTSANTFSIEVQRSQAIPASNGTQVGLAAFDSSSFTVDSNGFVKLVGAAAAIEKIAVQTGTTPIVPASGIVTINGATVSAGTNPVRTDGTGANTLAVEVQISQSLAAADSTKIGLSNFDSSSFSVAATGFVTLSTTGAGKTITGDDSVVLSPTANNWNIFGRSGSKTSGSGSTLTVKSPPFADAGASATSALNSGEFVTGAFTRTLPASAGLADGDLLEYVCTTSSALVIQAVSSQKIRVGSLISSAAGTLTSTSIGDSITLRFRASDGFFYATSLIGTWLVA